MIKVFFDKDDFFRHVCIGDHVIYNDCISHHGHVAVKITVDQVHNDSIIYTDAIIGRKTPDGKIVFDDKCIHINKNIRMKITYETLAMYAKPIVTDGDSHDVIDEDEQRILALK